MAAMEMTLPEDYVCMSSDELRCRAQGNGKNVAEIVLGTVGIACGTQLVKVGADQPPVCKGIGSIAIVVGAVSLQIGIYNLIEGE